jgi:hypothetical protein
MPKIKLFNRVGSSVQVINPVVGIALAEIGTPTYSTGQFGGKGVYTNSDSNYLKSATETIDIDSWYLGMWCKFDWGLASGSPSDAANHSWYNFHDGSGGSGTDGMFPFVSSGGGFGVRMYLHRSTNDTFYNAGSSISWSAGELFHLGIAFRQASTLDGTNYYKVYKNGVNLFNSSTQPGPSTGGPWNHWIGRFSYANGYQMDGLVDNPKIVSPITLADVEFMVKNRELERAGMNDSGTIV